ncbi:hypothetical protein C8F04DRAFT_1119191 [Mycena alexandri]|uniref:T6SS Phospholipase effector Tle1-like catalytic domain-containing protein n=1 Tax=Mycena alexandri TaxID=1745969 RepID=A0AAD6SLG9_9AGAR|nr:hypothetical protein C8F04DRAFT_1119191 [Mycena alexandri]
MQSSTATNGHGRFNTDNTMVDQNGISGLPVSSSPQTSAFTQQTVNGSAAAPAPSIIPPEHPFRTLVLCFDGTGDQFDADNSNIVQLFSMLPKADRSRQMVYYQAGIGTYTSPQIATPFWSKVSKFIDEAIAWNLDAHVMGGYEFLMQNYTATDRICIFGFSRGAYTARSLAGMLHKVGLLPADNHQQIPFAYKMYTNETEKGWAQSNAFKKAFSIDVDIEFVGVWDTVSSVGLLPKRLPFTTSNTIVRTFRHAVSLDERRAKFSPNLWNRPNATEQTLSISDNKGPPKSPHHSKKMSQHDLEHRYARDRSQPTDIDEVWFAGCHCDVGGGSVDNATVRNLARIPLRWMIRECFKTNSGIMFDCEGLRSIGLDPDSLYPHVAPRPPPLPLNNLRIQSVPTSKKQSKVQAEAALSNFASSEAPPTPHKTEEELDLLDAMCPIYDQLTLAWFWWILEFLPVKQRYQKGDNTWVTYFGWNMGRGRFIPKQKVNGVRVHRSVKMRLEAQTENGGKYEPKAAFDLERTTWVD